MRCTALTALFFALFALFSSAFHFQTTMARTTFLTFCLQPWRMLRRSARSLKETYLSAKINHAARRAGMR
jgi:hypothetical protein